MYIKQLYTGCLAEAAYYIESNGEAAIIDPLRDTQPYTELAEERGARIKFILETHFHADFVSGHLDLAKETGATIVYGPTALPNFTAHVAEDNEDLPLGNLTLRVLHTPGHTMESSTFLLLDERGKPHSIYTGDTLFIGDVGRPDLAVKSDLTQEDLAGHLFRSLRDKIIPLPDEVIVYPGHGKGSACGKNMSSKTHDTLGNQKVENYALDPKMGEEKFIEAILEGLVKPPQYFPKNAVMNKMGYSDLGEIMEKGLRSFTVEEFESEKAQLNTLVLDTREASAFTSGFIPGSLFIGIDGTFAPWVGALIEDLNTRILIVCDEGRAEEVVTRLARVGYDNPIGTLNGGFEAWKNSGRLWDTVRNINPEDYTEQSRLYPNVVTLDVRKRSEFESQHLEGATNFPLDFIHDHLHQLDPEKHYMLHCAGGYRSVIAISILKQYGIHQVTNIVGGFNALKKLPGLKISEFTPQTSML